MRNIIYTAPAGYVYDWAQPHYNDETGEQEHLNADRLSLSRFDKIENYILREVDNSVVDSEA